ncbi:hypothetical protein [Breznakia pachnodae]|uniref:Ni2+-binding GTPase involved in maturation of urease and hydrogenase n=1 Tax=Breznakia pachnodae TaxID=265178 RepID=A0ABU0E785_9FIRM|nr:hypothetical protein [Breznakia pachnodae]MDQ0362569.1 Ni2+-binding GTPase involved in maturation of urease and hydrogenase [Breznakia pachnodae]
MIVRELEKLSVVLGSSGSGKTYYTSEQLQANSKLMKCIVITGNDHYQEYQQIATREATKDIIHYVCGGSMSIFEVLRMIDFSRFDFVVVEDQHLSEVEARFLATIITSRYRAEGILVMQDYAEEWYKNFDC